MERKVLIRIRFILIATLCVLVFTGCPSIPREEQIRIEKEGEEILTKALLENYGLGSGDFRIISKNITWYTVQGFNTADYQIKVGDKVVNAEVDIDTGEVFTDYYGKEFEELLTDYLDQKMENIPVFKEMSLQKIGFYFYPKLAEGEYIFMPHGVLPASIAPEGFEEYLKKCEQDGSLIVSLSMVWYSKEQREVPDDLLSLLTGEKNKIPTRLEIKHLACESDVGLQPTDWIEKCYLSIDGARDHDVFDYLKVNENLFIQRTFDSYEAMMAGKGTFHAEFDNKGYLHITPGNENYMLFIKDMKEGTEIRRAMFSDEPEEETLHWYPLEITKYSDNWYMCEVQGWRIVIEEK